MPENKLFWKIFTIRSVICYFVIMALLLSCILRIAVITSADYDTVRAKQNSYKLKIADQRSTIFDRNLVPLTNDAEKIIAAVSPTPRAITGISSVLSGDELENVLKRLKSGKPVLCEIPRIIECDGIACTKVYFNANDNFAVHILGYTNVDNKGVSGIEAAYDDLLYSAEEIYFSYETSAKGDMLDGVTPTIVNDSSIRADGVVTTLDANIQAIAETAADNIETGAIVIADAKSCEILASVSRPDFGPEKITDFLYADNSPLLNRAINAYNVGSVFKPCVAAVGIEKGKGGYLYTCTGSCEIIDRFFRCHKLNGHGYTDLCSAIAQSCNTYFYNYSFKIGGDAVYNTASALKFGTALKLCDGIYTSKGNLPKKESLSNIAHLANFSIGQGELLLSPVSMLTLYCAIASDGAYYVPSLVKATLKNGTETAYSKGNRTRVMKAQTAKTLREYLEAVMIDGTGEDAKPNNVPAAGKTATAQTGKFENGIEICQGWFCGFFPADSPEYVVIVFSEDIKKQKKSCAEIFAQIADEIAK